MTAQDGTVTEFVIQSSVHCSNIPLNRTCAIQVALQNRQTNAKKFYIKRSNREFSPFLEANQIAAALIGTPILNKESSLRIFLDGF